jgi:hypothetical protein
MKFSLAASARVHRETTEKMMLSHQQKKTRLLLCALHLRIDLS